MGRWSAAKTSSLARIAAWVDASTRKSLGPNLRRWRRAQNSQAKSFGDKRPVRRKGRETKYRSNFDYSRRQLAAPHGSGGFKALSCGISFTRVARHASPIYLSGTFCWKKGAGSKH